MSEKAKKEKRRQAQQSYRSQDASECAPVVDFNFEDYKENALSDQMTREAIETFLKHRHREWEQ